MAPIVKDGETSVATTTVSSSANSLKSPNETPTRPQPVALEIPVTINGARTVEGSDKREPFSETTQTVLVFGHGAVVRVATPLAAGQLVFLTNEKTKKEVVSQVVKSKSGGSANGYVELQFTEPAPGFWGLRMPTVPPSPAQTPAPVSRPAVPVTSAPLKAITPAAPEAAKPVIPKTVTPAVPARPSNPPQPSMVPPPPQSKMPQLVSAEPVGSAVPLTPSLLHPPAPAPMTPRTQLPATPSATPPAHSPAIPPPPLRDYSREIDALFAAPSASSHPAPATPAPNATPPSSEPSTEELKLQAARLQAQLSSLLFTETPAAPPPAPVIRVTPKTDVPPPIPEVTKKALDIAQEEPKPSVKPEPKPAIVVPRPAPPSPSADDEEVRIPAWLAPLSRNADAAMASPPSDHSVAIESTPEPPAISEESFDSVAEEATGRSEAAVFGGQLLGETAHEDVEASSTGSNKKLFFVLAAAVIVVATGGWYFRASLFGSSPAAKGVNLPASTSSTTQPASAKDTPLVTPPTAPATSSAVASSTPPSSQPSKPLEPVSAPVASTGAAESRNFTPPSANNVAGEAVKKPALGEVHLSAPVVTQGKGAPQSGEVLPSIDTNVPNLGTDTLANVATTHSGAPSAPLPVGGEVTPAELIKSVPPVYPLIAKNQRISGNVQIDALIDASGNVAEMKVISGPSILHRAALDAVKQWKYKPAVLDGQPTTMHLTVTVQFRAQ